MGKEKERRPSAWRNAEEELPENGQIVITASLDSLRCKESDPVAAFGVAVFRKEVTYGEGDVEPEYVETRENVFCSEMWDWPDGEVTWWMPMPMLPEEGLKAYLELLKSRRDDK